MNIRCLLAFAVASVIIAGCTVSQASSGTSTLGTSNPTDQPSSSPIVAATTPVEPPPSRPPDPPVDTSIEPVSASHPSPSEREALIACGAYDLGLDRVAGMGLISHATDARRFGLSAEAPLLKVAAPAWVIQLRGEVPRLLIGETWIDPTCVVIDAEPTFYATGPIRSIGTGQIVRGYWPDRGTASVPPLSP